MSTENFVKSDTPVSREDFENALELPPAFAATIGLKDYWTNQENGQREEARLEACEHADDDIEADQEWTLPGYDPDDFRED